VIQPTEMEVSWDFNKQNGDLTKNKLVIQWWFKGMYISGKIFV
jgi:hypothetical protein